MIANLNTCAHLHNIGFHVISDTASLWFMLKVALKNCASDAAVRDIAAKATLLASILSLIEERSQRSRGNVLLDRPQFTSDMVEKIPVNNHPRLPPQGISFLTSVYTVNYILVLENVLFHSQYRNLNTALQLLKLL